MLRFKISSIKLDTPRILKEQNKRDKKFLYRASALTRTIVKRSIKKPTKKKRHAKAGSPPLSKTGTLKKTIMFWVDAKKASAKIGPMALTGSKTAPEVLELSGYAKSGWNKGKFQKARPYLGPALETSQKSFDKIYSQIKRT